MYLYVEIKCQLDATDNLYNALELLMMGIVLPETCWAWNKICNKYHLLHLVRILFPHNNEDARSKSLQNYIEVRFNPIGCLHHHYSSTLKIEAVRNCGQFHPDCSVSQPRRQQTHLHNRHTENCKIFCPHVTFMASFQPTTLFLVSLLLYVLLPSFLFCTVRFFV